MIKLFCAIVEAAGSAFPVEIDASLSVGDMKKAIKGQKKNNLAKVDADKLQLFLAKTKEDGPWLRLNEDGAASVKIDIDGHAQYSNTKLVKMESIQPLKKYVRELSEQDQVQVHVLVVVQEQEPTRTKLWLVTGSVENALNTKGIRCRLYRLAGSYLGYYDPARRAEDKDSALWYDGNTLRIQILFETRANALLLENTLQEESVTSTSPLNGHTVSTNVAFTGISRTFSQLQRIYGRDYDPDSDSPQASNVSTTTSIVDPMTDEFKYQLLESEKWFGSVGKAQSCHVMSREHCLKYPSYNKYNNDPSNRLALSAEMHEWFDARSYTVPTMEISVESASEGVVIDNRYQVNLVVRALNAEYADLLALRLKEGFVASEDGLEFRTSVYVLDKEVFCECMEWKCNETEQRWEDLEDMAPAVD